MTRSEYIRKVRIPIGAEPTMEMIIRTEGGGMKVGINAKGQIYFFALQEQWTKGQKQSVVMWHGPWYPTTLEAIAKAAVKLGKMLDEGQK